MQTGTIEHDESARILVVDDEQVIREILADFLSMEGYLVRTAEHGGAALKELEKSSYDLILSDLKMPQMGGLEFLNEVGKKMPDVVTIIMTGFGTVESAIDAMKQGAYDYIMKPFKVEDVVMTVRRGLERRRLQTENMRLRESISLYKVSEAIAASLSLDEVIRTVVDSTLNEVDADEVVVLLKDPATGQLFERARHSHARVESIRPSVNLDTAALERYFKQDKPLRAHGRNVFDYLKGSADNGDVQSLTVTSFRVRGETIGFLCAFSYTRGKRFNEGQRKLLSILANRAAAAIENAKLYDNLKATFHQTIQGLAQAIDKMDRYTAGHSERVATYSRQLAKTLKLTPDEIQLIHQSAQMHDIGKIGLVLNLNKPGKLTPEEYEEFKKHPAYGRDIIEPISFLHPLIPGVYSHHERWDGKGYPLGLKAEETPLMARVIAVADTYDAMTTNRAYRGALSHTTAIEEIKRCSATQFDPAAAEAFVKGIESYREEAKARGEQVVPEQNEPPASGGHAKAS